MESFCSKAKTCTIATFCGKNPKSKRSCCKTKTAFAINYNFVMELNIISPEITHFWWEKICDLMEISNLLLPVLCISVVKLQNCDFFAAQRSPACSPHNQVLDIWFKRAVALAHLRRFLRNLPVISVWLSLTGWTELVGWNLTCAL